MGVQSCGATSGIDHLLRNIVLAFPAGLEPTSPASEADALSIELQEHGGSR